MAPDRPLLDLVLECAEALPAEFSMADVGAWVERNYPEVHKDTVTAYIRGLCEGRKPDQGAHLSRYPPMFRRVGRGRYQLISRARIADVRRLAAEPPPTAPTGRRVFLIADAKAKRAVAAPGEQLFGSVLFERRSTYAVESGNPWYILSGRWGLVKPTEVIAPYDAYLNVMHPKYREAWGRFVAAQLALEIRVPGTVFEVHASRAYVDAIRAPIVALGGSIVVPVAEVRVPELLLWYQRALGRDSDEGSTAGHGRSGPGDPAFEDAVTDVVKQLSDPAEGIPADRLRTLTRSELPERGMYSWWIDSQGAAELSLGWGRPVSPGMIYVGAGGAASASRPPHNALWDSVIAMHLGGDPRFSPFRSSLISALGLPDEEALSRWMDQHLRVVVAPWDDAHTLNQVEYRVLYRMHPALNPGELRFTVHRSLLPPRSDS